MLNLHVDVELLLVNDKKTMKKTLALFIILFTFSISVISQTIINTPTINKYANVLTFDYCKNTVNLPTGMGGQFAIGDKILIIQMKGASLNDDIDADNGTVEDFGDAGNYEINEIKTINSSATDDIVLKFEIERAYNTSHAVQIVSIPQYEDVEIQNTLICQAWDGSTGGILAFNASGTITLNANIDASNRGFRGGVVQNGGSSACFALGGFLGYNCNFSLECGASKGEGIGFKFDNQDLGRGVNANGGGGGNDHNAGGGGGGSYGYGGMGGNTGGACIGLGGLGGEPLTYSNSINKIFNTGGGGAGDGGSSAGVSASTDGGNAGGLIFITGKSIKSNNFKLITNGADVTSDAYFDGAGGGGGGGLVILDIETYTDPLQIENNGGKGGNVEDNFSCAGPGGGGSGGITWLSQSSTPSNVSINAIGGQIGEFTLALCIGTDSEALPGDTGNYYFDFTTYVSTNLFEQMTLVAGNDTTICGDEEATLWAKINSSKEYDFHWEWTSGTDTNENFNFSPLFGGDLDVAAIAEFDINGQHCEETYIINVDVHKPVIEIVASSFFGDTIIIGEAYFLNAVVTPLNPSYIYSWTPADKVNPAEDRNTTATPHKTEEFCLNVTDEINCTVTECVKLYVTIPKITSPDAFTPNNDNINNTFLPLITEDLDIVSFRIYNRWGALIYTTTEAIAWDGTKDGTEQESAIYTWHLKTEQKISGEILEQIGVVTILR
jgi:gliding motility-associated-like protein